MRVCNTGLGPIRDIRHGFALAEKVTFEWRPEGWAKISKVNVGAERSRQKDQQVLRLCGGRELVKRQLLALSRASHSTCLSRPSTLWALTKECIKCPC